MTELLDTAAQDAEEVIIAWLQPLGPTAAFRLTNDPLPFRVVTRITGLDDQETGVDDPIVSVHTFVSASDPQAAAVECRNTHLRMLYLAHHIPNITLSDGSIANIDYLNVTESPIWVEYGDDQILRKVGRYQFGLAFIAVTS